MAAPPKNIIEMAADPSLKRGVNENLSLGQRKSEIVGRFTFARNPRSQVLMGPLALSEIDVHTGVTMLVQPRQVEWEGFSNQRRFTLPEPILPLTTCAHSEEFCI